MSFLDSVTVDAQTSITALVGAVAGAASSRVGGYIIHKGDIGGQGSGLGGLGLQFITHAVVASVGFGIAARVAPATSQNVFFSILFFASDGALVRSGAALGHRIVGGVVGRSEERRGW